MYLNKDSMKEFLLKPYFQRNNILKHTHKFSWPFHYQLTHHNVWMTWLIWWDIGFHKNTFLKLHDKYMLISSSQINHHHFSLEWIIFYLYVWVIKCDYLSECNKGIKVNVGFQSFTESNFCCQDMVNWTTSFKVKQSYKILQPRTS